MLRVRIEPGHPVTQREAESIRSDMCAKSPALGQRYRDHVSLRIDAADVICTLVRMLVRRVF